MKTKVGEHGDTGAAISVFYRTGPCDIHFCGRTWFRGMSQTVTPGKWAEMQARGDFNEFDFTEEK
jgi:hypothetical protein